MTIIVGITTAGIIVAEASPAAARLVGNVIADIITTGAVNLDRGLEAVDLGTSIQNSIAGNPTEAANILASTLVGAAVSIIVTDSAVTAAAIEVAALAAGVVLSPAIVTATVVVAGIAAGYAAGKYAEWWFKEHQKTGEIVNPDGTPYKLPPHPAGDANRNGIPDIHESGIDPRTKTAADAAKATLPPRRDPLTLDLDNDGLETTAIAATNPILFDHDGDGIKNGTGWVSSDDGFLVLDKNGNGSIDSGRELFGDNTIKSNGQTATDGFDALADLDSIANGGNADGRISSADAQFANLRIWRDLNQDGISQSNELFTLSSQNIASINVTKTANSQTLANGNQIADLGSFTRTDGSTGTAGAVTGNLADINLASDTFHRTFPNVLDTTSVATLPDMQGSGAVRDLREAATQSITLQSLLTQFSAATTRAGQMALIDQLLDAWADTGGMAESLDDRAAAATYTLTNGVTVPYVVIYDRFGTVVRSFEVVGGQTSGGTGGGGGSSGGSFTGRDVDNPTLTQAFRDTIAAWTQKLHIIESFNGSYFFGLPNSSQTQGAVTGMTSTSSNTSGGSMSVITAIPITISYEQAQLDLLQQSYDAIRSSVYQALLLQTRLKPLLDQINLVIDASGISLDFSQVNATFETKIGQNAANDEEWRMVA